VRVRDPEWNKSVDLVTVHLNLIEADRRAQIEKLVARLTKTIAPEAPLLIAGDFNDWRGQASRVLGPKLGMVEVHELLHGRLARTFPSWLPLLRLDRIYSRGLEPKSVEVLRARKWRGLSDHLPLFAEFAW
jgi:endonuclease/exonuclease/phosphatase family metal-dependent hydrolase